MGARRVSFTTPARKRERAIERQKQRVAEKRSADLERAQRRREVQNRRARTRLAVETRASVQGHVKCEGCGALIDVWEMHHTQGKGGRRSGIPEEWASTPELCLAVCCARTWGDRVGCHEIAQRNLDPSVRLDLEWQAVARLDERLNGRGTVAIWPADIRPLDAVRSLIRAAQVEGIEP